MTDPTPGAQAGDATQDVYTNVPADEVQVLRERLLEEGATSVAIHADGHGTYTVTATFPA